MPLRSARSSASSLDPSDEYLEGIETPNTFSAPIASAAIVAQTAESIPPLSPRTTELKLFF